MARLLLIRHGQASFRQANYDQLSPLGMTQARLLGEYAARRRIAPHRLITGPLERQKQTTDQIVAAYHEAGITTPEIEEMPAFREHFGPVVMQYAFSEEGSQDPSLAEIRHLLLNEKNLDDREHSKLFRAVMRRWLDGQFQPEGTETFAQFRQRVRQGLREIQNGYAKGQLVAVVTSGGVIAAAMGEVLNLDDHQIMELSMYVRNASITELIYGRHRLNLLAFNQTPHLEQEQITFI